MFNRWCCQDYSVFVTALYVTSFCLDWFWKSSCPQLYCKIDLVCCGCPVCLFVRCSEFCGSCFV
ncbi:hypothetical protein Hdeb2414_s0020g00558991 [Helianthus debilis subsp. tardiflorus]